MSFCMIEFRTYVVFSEQALGGFRNSSSSLLLLCVCGVGLGVEVGGVEGMGSRGGDYITSLLCDGEGNESAALAVRRCKSVFPSVVGEISPIRLERNF